MKKHYLIFLLAMMGVSSSHAVIYFSEAYPNPCGPQEGVNGLTGGLEGREWFEITNPDATAFSMDGLPSLITPVPLPPPNASGSAVSQSQQAARSSFPV